MNYKIIGGDGKEYGPVTDAELRKWIAEGRLNALSLARAETDAEFRPLSTFAEFADLFGAAAHASSSPGAAYPGSTTDWSNQDYQLDIGGCISRGWTLFMDHIGILLGCTVLYLIIVIVASLIVGGIIGIVTLPVISEKSLHPAAFTIIQGIIMRIILALFAGPMVGGYYYVFIQAVRGQSPTIGDLFLGFQKAYVQLFLGYLIFTMVAVICFIPFSIVEATRVQPVLEHFQHSPTPQEMRGLMQELLSALASTSPMALLCMIPAIYLITNLLFALPLIIDREMDFWTAIQTSWKMIHKHWFAVFGLLLLTGLINIVGVFLCCVGVIFTLAITTAALMFAYETIFCNRRS